MRKKKLIVIVCAVILIAAVAVPTALHFAKKDNASPVVTAPDAQTSTTKVPAEPVLLPQTIETDSALQSATLDDAPIRTDDAVKSKPVSEQAFLFGRSYAARVWRSAETYTGVDGVEAPAQRKTEYLDADGNVQYISLHEKDDMAVYSANGQILYSTGAYKIEAAFTTEPVHWFYKDGRPVCAEVCYYNADGTDTGAAYYGADGALLGRRGEVFRTEEDDVQMQTEYRNAQENTITEDAFLALLPQTDADDFLYIQWS